MTDIFRKPDDPTSVQAKDTDTQPIVIRKLDRLETTSHQCFNTGG
jgi:hypothetical protein